MYIHQLKDWPNFTWNNDALIHLLSEVRFRQGKILGLMSQAGFKLQESAILDTLTLDVTKSSEIEGEKLNTDQVRSSIARRLGIEVAGLLPAERHVEGVVEMMLDATQNYRRELSAERLFDWHAALFPTGRSGMQKITVAAWRKPDGGPMQVVSGAMGKEKVHFEAPKAELLENEMTQFIHWLNTDNTADSVIKAAIAHLWFVTIHPFDDGNGRMTRAITDLLLARADRTSQRFYSMSAQILNTKKAYYDALEYTQKGSLDITSWLRWFLECLYQAMADTEEMLAAVAARNRFWESHKATVLNERQQKLINKLFDEFFGKLTTAKWAKITHTSTDTALRDIQDLIAKGVLKREEGGSKNASYSLIVPE